MKIEIEIPDALYEEYMLECTASTMEKDVLSFIKQCLVECRKRAFNDKIETADLNVLTTP